jgi:hypothetical protein
MKKNRSRLFGFAAPAALAALCAALILTACPTSSGGGDSDSVVPANTTTEYTIFTGTHDGKKVVITEAAAGKAAAASGSYTVTYDGTVVGGGSFTVSGTVTTFTGSGSFTASFKITKGSGGYTFSGSFTFNGTTVSAVTGITVTTASTGGSSSGGGTTPGTGGIDPALLGRWYETQEEANNPTEENWRHEFSSNGQYRDRRLLTQNLPSFYTYTVSNGIITVYGIGLPSIPDGIRETTYSINGTTLTLTVVRPAVAVPVSVTYYKKAN